MGDDPNPLLLQVRGLVKSFPGVQALRGVDLELRRGEVLALLGENGAGKSTLLKTLGGAHRPDAGEIRIEGQEADLSTPSAARRSGVGIIYQEFNLVPFLNVRENLYLGRPRGGSVLIDVGAERAGARALLGKLGVDIDPDIPVRRLSIAEQQIVEIAKALVTQVRILVMDEPTAALSPEEVERLFAIIRDLTAQGVGVIYVSHRLDEVFRIADRVTVLRDGEHVATRPTKELTRKDLIELMVGRSIENEFPPRQPSRGALVLEVEGLSRGDRVRDVSFKVHAGEVLGLTGLVGAGRTELVRLLFGADRADAGRVRLDGRPLDLRGPLDAIRASVCLLTEDRKSQGLSLRHGVRENFGLPNLDRFSRWGVIDGRRETSALQGFVDRMRIRLSGLEQTAGTLSGGNQQKVVLAKWLERDCRVLLIDEPTRGIDVGARYEIYALIRELASRGKAVVMVSSEMTEILGMSDRILVMREGRISVEFEDVAGTTQRQIMEAAAH